MLGSSRYLAGQPGRSAATFLDLPPQRILMLASHAFDLAAAHETGMATAYVPRPEELGYAASAEPQSGRDLMVFDLE